MNNQILVLKDSSNDMWFGWSDGFWGALIGALISGLIAAAIFVAERILEKRRESKNSNDKKIQTLELRNYIMTRFLVDLGHFTKIHRRSDDLVGTYKLIEKYKNYLEMLKKIKLDALNNTEKQGILELQNNISITLVGIEEHKRYLEHGYFGTPIEEGDSGAKYQILEKIFYSVLENYGVKDITDDIEKQIIYK